MFLKVFLLLIIAAGATTTCPRCHHSLQAKKKVDKVSQKSWMMFPAPKPQSFTGRDSRGPYRCWPLNPQPRSKTEGGTFLSSLKPRVTAISMSAENCMQKHTIVGVTCNSCRSYKISKDTWGRQLWAMCSPSQRLLFAWCMAGEECPELLLSSGTHQCHVGWSWLLRQKRFSSWT